MTPVQIRSYSTPQAAYIAKGMLETNGIEAFVRENASESVFPAPDAGISGTSLYVNEKDAEKASALLREHED